MNLGLKVQGKTTRTITTEEKQKEIQQSVTTYATYCRDQEDGVNPKANCTKSRKRPILTRQNLNGRVTVQMKALSDHIVMVGTLRYATATESNIYSRYFHRACSSLGFRP